MRRRFPVLLLSAALATTTAAVVVDRPTPPAAADVAALSSALAPPVDLSTGRSTEDGTRLRPAGSDPSTWQTSDRVIGPHVTPRAARTLARATVEREYRYRVAPGVVASAYRETSAERRIRYHVLTAKWRKPGVGIRVAHPSAVARTAPTTRMVRRTRDGVAGVNGDFFDIGDTGAPLGVGVDEGRLVNGRTSGWNAGFYLDARGVPRIGQVPVTIAIGNRAQVAVTNFNSAQVMPNGIGIYTPAWGTTSGFRWTDGQRRDVRMLRVEDGRIVEKRTVFPAGQEFTGRILVARGALPAAQFDALAVGDRVRTTGRPAEGIRTAVTGNEIVLDKGEVLATEDSELHPRTAIGIDRQRGRIILLVVEGRQESSDGYTMVEVAKKLRSLGAVAGLNLDGGGSSTLAGLREDRIRLLSSPSDGRQRPVANALVVAYHRPGD
ncbi:phosphodiester glycosidase family protein [Nocardioides sp. GY 10113]|uniref:phosphodiester glycosidase family protein n=1 Tax=Nocardioides sp. GY 10113 TaxID=2569761 RepID=UPI0010A770E3|nr:phosphodiester glycosidase family protein [Nocardioides sp. GY 10113]TIC85903.1 phosphodiester glycosidase family protein [Nocardioides sp. GY 10113]